MKNNIYIIGCGGVGSWLAPAMCLLRSPDQITLVDGDSLERKNLNRQLFETTAVGKNKAFALAGKYGCHAVDEFYSMGMWAHNKRDWLFVCADNNPARIAALSAADDSGCQVIIAANETTSAEAYYYRREWRGGPLDPRVYYPTMTTDASGDPRAASAGCTGEAQKQNPQLVTANASAAALAGSLFVLWGVKFPGLDREIMPELPFKFVQNLSKLESFKIKDQTKVSHVNQ